ncbi:MAG: hypothetical protein ACFFAY_11675 [Promethearchaeota archaeon]
MVHEYAKVIPIFSETEAILGDSVSARTWKLKVEDGSVSEFQDIRRKVGNQIHRTFLLNNAFSANRIEKIKATLRGPKDEFKNFDNFFVISASQGSQRFKILVEANVYENLRIVATDSERISECDPDTIVEVFTAVLTDLESHNTRLSLSEDTKVCPK